MGTSEQINLETRHQTDLRIASICPASWTLNRRNGKQTIPAARGTAVHLFVERYNQHRAKVGRQTDIEAGRAMIPGILSEFAYLPPETQEEIHQLCNNVVDTHLLNLGTYYGSEETFTADLGAVMLSGRVDELHIADDEAEIVDTKSNHIVPSPATVAEDFQLKTYGALVIARFPQIQTLKGTIFTPRFGTFRSAEWERGELVRWLEHLGRLAASLESGDRLEAVPHSNCQYCAAFAPGGKCPAKRTTYGIESVIRSAAEAVEAAKQILALEQRLKARRTVLQSYTKELGSVQAGGREFGYFESESINVRAGELPDALIDNPELNPWGFLSVSAADLKKLQKILGKESAPIIADISDVKTSTRFSHKAIGAET